MPADVPNGTAPESAPGDLTIPGQAFPNWALEHFYYMLQADPNSTVPTTTCRNQQGALVCTDGTGPLVYRNAVEASFNTATPVTGEQITFNRWRVDHPGVRCSGSYTIATPFKTKTYNNLLRGDPIKDTEDIGIGPNFDGALAGSVGPFAFPAATPGGARLPLVTGADGKTYLSDGGALSAITGAPNGNVLTFTGPGAVTGTCGTIETYTQTQFNVVGRVFQGAVGPRLAVEKTTYKSVAGRYQIGVWGKAMQEANATGAPTVTVNLTGDPGVAASGNLLAKSFPMPQGAAAVTGQLPTTEHEFFLGNNADTVVTGKSSPKWNKAEVTVADPTNPNLVQKLIVPLLDEVTVGNVVFNSTARTLTIPATSGANLVSPTVVATATTPGKCSVPCLKVGGAGLPVGTNLEIPVTTVGATTPSGSLVISGIDVPPAFVTVTSSLGGSDTVPVQYIGAAANTVLIQNDNVVTIKNAPEVVADVLANDIGYRIDPANNVAALSICTSSASTIGAAGIGVTATTAGTCTATTTPSVPPATCTVNNTRTTTAGCTPLGGKVWRAGNELRYSPPANATGTDMFWYQVGTNQTATSTARALVTVKIFDAGVGPQVIGDSAFAVAGKPVDLNVLINDVSPFGFAPNSVDFTAGWTPQLVVPAGAAPVLAPTTAYAVLPSSQVRFTPPSAGQWIFRYTFKDTQGTLAASGAVVVNAVAAEGIAVTGAVARTGRDLAVSGTVTPVNGSTPPTVPAPLLRLKIVPTGGFCAANPNGVTLNTADPAAVVTAAGTYDFGVRPFATGWAVVYDPEWGGCGEAQIQVR